MASMPIKILDSITKILKAIHDLLPQLFVEPAYNQDPKELPMNQPDKKDNLHKFCTAIKIHEGWYEGSRSWRNNNPGNARYSSVGYLPIYGKVGRDKNNFAIFSDYITGWLYLSNLVKDKIKKNPTWNFYQFFSNYAPDSDGNNSKQYAEVVAKKVGVSPNTVLSTII